jgi:DNA-binding NarL/FixJ family response regulator
MDSNLQGADGRADKPTARRRVFLVDDHPLVLEGLTKLIDQCEDLCVCGAADGVDRACKGILASQPEVVVLDLSLRGESGFELIRRLQALPTHPPVLVLSMHEDPTFVERAIHAGALGYVMKREVSGSVVSALRKVLLGELYVSDVVTERILGKFVRRKDASRSRTVASLSYRELEVFRRIGQGLANRSIATELHISLKTVQTHCHHIKRKLGLESGTTLMREAVRWVEAHEGNLGQVRP